MKSTEKRYKEQMENLRKIEGKLVTVSFTDGQHTYTYLGFLMKVDPFHHIILHDKIREFTLPFISTTGAILKILWNPRNALRDVITVTETLSAEIHQPVLYENLSITQECKFVKEQVLRLREECFGEYLRQDDIITGTSTPAPRVKRPIQILE